MAAYNGEKIYTNSLNKRIEDLETSKKWIKRIAENKCIDVIPIQELKRAHVCMNTRLAYLRKTGDASVIDLIKKMDGYPGISAFLGDVAY